MASREIENDEEEQELDPRAICWMVDYASNKSVSLTNHLVENYFSTVFTSRAKIQDKDTRLLIEQTARKLKLNFLKFAGPGVATLKALHQLDLEQEFDELLLDCILYVKILSILELIQEKGVPSNAAEYTKLIQSSLAKLAKQAGETNLNSGMRKKLQSINTEIEELLKSVVLGSKKKPKISPNESLKLLQKKYTVDILAQKLEQLKNKAYPQNKSVIDTLLATTSYSSLLREDLDSVLRDTLSANDIRQVFDMTEEKWLNIHRLIDPEVRAFVSSSNSKKAPSSPSKLLLSPSANGSAPPSASLGDTEARTKIVLEESAKPHRMAVRPPTAAVVHQAEAAWDSDEDDVMEGANQRVASRKRQRAEQPKKRPEGLTQKGQRKKVKWTNEEVGDLVKAIRLYGTGRWEDIKKQYPKEFELRTAVDLKDKWRNLQKHYTLEELYGERK